MRSGSKDPVVLSWPFPDANRVALPRSNWRKGNEGHGKSLLEWTIRHGGLRRQCLIARPICEAWSLALWGRWTHSNSEVQWISNGNLRKAHQTECSGSSTNRSRVCCVTKKPEELIGGHACALGRRVRPDPNVQGAGLRRVANITRKASRCGCRRRCESGIQ